MADEEAKVTELPPVGEVVDVPVEAYPEAREGVRQGCDTEVAKVLDEVNSQVESEGMRASIAGWLNRVMGALDGTMKLPPDADGVPCMPGDVMEHPDGESFEVLAVDAANVYYDIEGGAVPTSVALASAVRHTRISSALDCVLAFERELELCRDEDDRQAARRALVDRIVPFILEGAYV